MVNSKQLVWCKKRVTKLQKLCKYAVLKHFQYSWR